MTAHELLESQLADAGFQLDKTLEGMSDATLDHKVTPGAMTPREQVAHLMEAYHAFLETTAGRKHEWGSYHPAAQDAGGLIAEFKAKRAQAVAAALDPAHEAKLHEAHEFLIGHDYYHVGQMCLARIATQPDWNSYAIYKE
jgi:hypothetical protein